MRQPGHIRIRLKPIVRGTLDKLKPRVLKKRDQRKAAHIAKGMKQLRGSHAWARRHARMLKSLGLDGYEPFMGGVSLPPAHNLDVYGGISNPKTGARFAS